MTVSTPSSEVVPASVASRSAATVAVTVVICTRARGAAALSAIRSALANDHPSFEVLVVDQNTDGSAEGVRSCVADPRVTVLEAPPHGLSAARNLGLRRARGAIVTFLDDDCTVPADWLRSLCEVFAKVPHADLVFSNVEPGPHDSRRGFIPANVRGEDRSIRTLWEKRLVRGIGAGMSVRRAAALSIGGFDERLGAGAEFGSAEDSDLQIRMLLAGHAIHETAAVAVVHHGFRSWEQGRELARRDWCGMGAGYAKFVRARRWRALPVVLYDPIVVGVGHPLRGMLRGRSPRGLRNPVYFAAGFLRGLRSPVDSSDLTFSEP